MSMSLHADATTYEAAPVYDTIPAGEITLTYFAQFAGGAQAQQTTVGYPVLA